MPIDIESLKECGIGMWFMYISYEIYVWVSGMNITSVIIGSVVYTVFAVSMVACMIVGTYLMARGTINMIKED